MTGLDVVEITEYYMEACVRKDRATMVSPLSGYSPRDGYCFTVAGGQSSDDVKLVVNLIWDDNIITLDSTNPHFIYHDDRGFLIREEGGPPPKYIEISAVPLSQDEVNKCIHFNAIEFRFNQGCTNMQGINRNLMFIVVNAHSLIE